MDNNKNAGADSGIIIGRDRGMQDIRVESKMPGNPVDMNNISAIRISFSVKNDVWTVSCPEFGLSSTCDSICYAVYNLYRQIDRLGVMDRPVREIVSGPCVKMVFSFRDDNP